MLPRMRPYYHQYTDTHCVFFCLAGQASADAEGLDMQGYLNSRHFSATQDRVNALSQNGRVAMAIELRAQAETLASSQCDTLENTLAMIQVRRDSTPFI